MNDYNNLEFERQNTPEEMGMRLHTLNDALPLIRNTIVVNYLNTEAIQPAIDHPMAAPQPQIENPLITEQGVTDLEAFRQQVDQSFDVKEKQAHDFRQAA